MNEAPSATEQQEIPIFWDHRQEILRQLLPNYPDRIDLTLLNRLDPDLGFFFIEQFLNGKGFNKEVAADFELDQKFKHLYFQSKSIERTEGLKSFGLGFPMFMAAKDGELIVAPLFIWRMQLSPRFDRDSSWFLTSKGQPEVDSNPYLVNYIKRHYQLDTEDSLYRILHDGTVTATEIAEYCQELSAKLGLADPGEAVVLSSCPEVKAIDELAAEGNIQWSGVLGIYPPLPEFFGLPVSKEVLKPESKSYKGHSFGVPNLDPHQASAKKAVFENRITLVEGNAGTGKSHLLTHLLTNALSNGKKVLVVSSSMESLKGAQLNLSKAGISQLNFLLKDPVHDKGLLLELLRATAEGGVVPVNHNEEYFRIVLDKCSREQEKLERHYEALRKEVYAGYGWTESVGLFLASNKIEGKELLSSQLNAQGFKMEASEYEELTSAIDESAPLYKRINTLKHPLNRLNAGIFIHHSKEEGLDFIQSRGRSFYEKGTLLQHRYITKINLYAEELLDHYEDYYKRLANRVQQLQDLIADYKSQFGTSYLRGAGKSMSLVGVFSEKHRLVQEAKEETQSLYRRLAKTFESNAYFDFKFLKLIETKSPAKINESVAEFSQTLRDWQSGIQAQVQEEVARLNQKTAHPSLDFREQVRDLEYSLDLYIEELNEAGLYQLPLENKMLTLPKRQRYLEEILEMLEDTQLNLRDYSDFYDWQSHWFGLSEGARKVVKALIKVKPINWKVAFRSWYLNHCLTEKYSPSLPIEPYGLQEFVKEYHKLKPLLTPQISYLWQQRKEQYLKQFRKQHKTLFNQLFGRKNQELSKDLSLKVVLEKGFEAVTEVLPIFFAPPHLADNIIPEEEGLFDLVVYYEAQFLAFDQVAPLLSLGKRIVIMTDPDQELQEVDWKLPAAARENGVEAISLKTVHRWSPGNLLQLNQVSGVNHHAVQEFGMAYHQVDGQFDEEARINDAEAQEVIRLLNEIRKTPQRTYPSVGIACFTEEQRDLIDNYLLQIKRQRQQGAEKIQQLERNGLGVYLADDIHGQQFDVLIVSGTFAPVDSKGKLCRQFATLDDNEGMQKINLLLSRTRKEVIIVNSIPESELETLAADSSKPGRSLLSNYYLYAKAVEAEDEQTQQNIALRFLGQHLETTENFSSIFLRELAKAMEPYLEQGRIQLDLEENHMFFPLLINPVHPNEPPIVIRPDGFFAATPATDFYWEHQREEQLRAKGYHHLPVWSVKWWKNTRQEARRLASLVIKHDEAYRVEEI